MSNDNQGPVNNNANIFLAIILIGAGILFLLRPVFNIDIGHFTWPFFVIVPGVALFVLALSVGDPGGEPLAIVGTVITVVGLILLFQNTTNQWATWAYVWALVAPTSIGLGLILYGSIKGHPTSVTNGARLFKVGLAIFLVGAVFFELVIGISGFGLGNMGWPILLIALGVLLLFRNFLSAHKSQP
jgi:hypothetical protein